jgi:hypothetical protein
VLSLFNEVLYSFTLFRFSASTFLLSLSSIPFLTLLLYWWKLSSVTLVSTFNNEQLEDHPRLLGINDNKIFFMKFGGPLLV